MPKKKLIIDIEAVMLRFLQITLNHMSSADFRGEFNVPRERRRNVRSTHWYKHN